MSASIQQAARGQLVPALRVALVDDDQSVHQSLRRIFETYASGWKLDSYPSGRQALRQLPPTPPNVVLMDIRQPDLSGINCARTLNLVAPQVPIVMYTACSDDITIIESIMAGACGYLVKPVPPERLVWALAEAALGRTALCSEAQARLAQYVQRLGTTRCSLGLSFREHEIMTWAIGGLRNKEIAERLSVSEGTIHTHINRAFKKLRVKTRQQARDKLLFQWARPATSP